MASHFRFALLHCELGMIYVDNDFIWVATNHLVAISRKNPKKQTILASFDRGSQCISGDSAGNIWAVSYTHLYRYVAYPFFSSQNVCNLCAKYRNQG